MHGRKLVLSALGLGFLTQALVQGYDRFLYVAFPLNLFGTLFLCMTLLGVALGAFLSGWGARHRATLEPAFALASIAFLVGICLSRNVSIHYLLANQYYPYPKPTHYEARTAGLVVAWVLSAGLVAYVTGAFARLLATQRALETTFASYVGGLALGGIASYVAHQTIDPYRTMMVWAVLATALLARRALVPVVVAAVAVIAVVSEHQVPALKSSWTAPAPFLWRQNDRVLQSRHWTPYYKLDFVSFKDDQCLGGVYNNLMLWYHCKDADLLPREISAAFRAAGEGTKSVLAVGRTDSMYLSLIERWHGPLERSLSLEYDETVVRQVTGPYSAWFNDRWRRPGHEARSGDLRHLLYEIDERFDMVYLNGQMIRLYLQPRMLLPQEDYLFDRDSIARMMELLNPGGLLVIDWGSSQEEELYDVVSNLPEGTHASAFWTTLSNLPMSGLPLFFIFVSEDEARVEEIATRIGSSGMDPSRSHLYVEGDDAKIAAVTAAMGFPTGSGSDGYGGGAAEPSWPEVGIEMAKGAIVRPITDHRTVVDTDDRPFLQHGLTFGYAFLAGATLVVSGLVAALVGLRRGPPALAAAWPRSRRVLFLTIGVVFGLLETLVVGRYSIAHPTGAPMGAALLAPLFLGGYALPCVPAVAQALRGGGVASLALAALAGCGGLALGVVGMDSLAAVALASALLGLSSGTLLWTVLPGVAPELRARAWGWERLGALAGMLAFQPAMLGFGLAGLGFRQLALLLGAVVVLAALWASRAASAHAPASGGGLRSARPEREAGFATPALDAPLARSR